IENKAEEEGEKSDLEEILIDRLEVPETLEKMQEILDEIETDCNKIIIPITEQKNVKATLEDLKLIFAIEKAPDYLFKLKLLLEATW
ncbi:45401_t:CDS:1, partial [Gigaspora margarita]